MNSHTYRGLTLAQGSAAKELCSTGFTVRSRTATPLWMVGLGSKRTVSGLRVWALGIRLHTL